MVYFSRIPEIIDLLRQVGRYDEQRFQRELQTYWPEICAKFHNLLTIGQQSELLERFVFSLTFVHGSRFPGDMESGHLPMLPGPVDGFYTPHSFNDDFILFGIPPSSQFSTVFREMQVNQRRLHQIAIGVVPTNSQSHVDENRRRVDGRSLEAANLRSAISLPQIDDSQDDDSQDHVSQVRDSQDHDFEDTHDQDDRDQHDDGQDDVGQDSDGPTAVILGAISEPADDDICPICCEGYSDAQPFASLIPNCGHFFHLGCMVQWIDSDFIGGRLRDRCICCRRNYTRIFSQSYGEVTPPQNGESFWRNDNGPLVSEVFPRRAIRSPRYSSEETESWASESSATLDETILYGVTQAELDRLYPRIGNISIETNDGAASYFEVPPGQEARNDQVESQD